jgi:membrane protein DedA with SNARE-associated domain
VRHNRFLKNGMLSKEHVGRTIFLSRFIVGLRFFGPVFAGMMKAPWRVFLTYHLLAMSIYVPFFVFIGYHFHRSFLRVLTQVEFVKHIVFTILLVIIGTVIVHHTRKRDKEDVDTITEVP